MVSLDGTTEKANWISGQVELDEIIEVDQTSKVDINRDGIIVNKSSLRPGQAKQIDYVHPCSDQVVWNMDFYDL